MLSWKTGSGSHDRRACIAARRCGLMAALLLAAAGSACAAGQPGLAAGAATGAGAGVRLAQADDIARQRTPAPIRRGTSQAMAWSTRSGVNGM